MARQKITEQSEDKDREVVKPMCKYCTEDIYFRQGRLGTVYRPMRDARFCPMCGREKTAQDKDY